MGNNKHLHCVCNILNVYVNEYGVCCFEVSGLNAQHSGV